MLSSSWRCSRWVIGLFTKMDDEAVELLETECHLNVTLYGSEKPWSLLHGHKAMLWLE
jgi:hypothetical protein